MPFKIIFYYHVVLLLREHTLSFNSGPNSEHILSIKSCFWGGFLYVETYSTIQKLVYWYEHQHTKDACPFIAKSAVAQWLD